MAINDILKKLMDTDIVVHGNQNELARQTGIPQTTIRNILLGITTRPQSNTVKALTKYYNISQHQLMGEAFIDYEKIQTQFLPIASQPQPAPDINIELLTEVIETLESWLDDHCLTLAAEKKAKIIQILYCDYIDQPEQKITASQIKNLFGLST
ncbi:MAG TPA: XRE family transcriptional regulator [Gammaproteobacteria bacterium]|nr:XRE family transcriptional regulator [Gammaproteobacteria bacterium]